MKKIAINVALTIVDLDLNQIIELSSRLKSSPFNLNRTDFIPHISLGIGDLNKEISNRKVTLKSIIISQLGNYCTCRKVLFEQKFSSIT